MRSSSSSSASGLPAKRSKRKAPVQRSPFTDFGNYMAEKNRKLTSQFEAEASSSSLLNSEPSSSGDGKGIFHSVSIFVDGYTVPSSQELRGYMLWHGGRFENYFSRSRVSHIICSNLPDSKMRNIRAFSRGLPVLRPAWVVDSVAANKLLSWSPYQLVGHSSEIYKQQKLSAFFGCKTISSLKEAEVVFDFNVQMDPEGWEKSKGSSLPLESKVFDRPIQNSSRIDDVNSGEPTIAKFLQASDVHHSTLTDPNFVENYFKALGGTIPNPEVTKTSGSATCELNHSKKEEDSGMMVHQVELPAVSCSSLNILQIKSTTCADPMDWASGFSSKVISIIQNISEDASLYKSSTAKGDISYSASVTGDSPKNFPNHIESDGSEKSKINLWSGSPPKWVEKFEVSNCLILNLIAQSYTKFGADGLLSSILQSLISLYPLILGSSSDEPAKPPLDMCELLLQYIDHKIESDIEELYLCCRLLERLTTMSNFFSEVYSAFLSPLQVSVSENYGGTLHLTGSGD